MYFGVKHQIAQLFSNPEWAQHFDSEDKWEMPYFHSPEYRRLCASLQERGLDTSSCVFVDIGHDGF